MEIPFFNLSRQYEQFSKDLEKRLQAFMRKGDYRGEGEIAAFEQKLSAALSHQAVCGVGSGSQAIELAFQLLGIGPGDEVVMPAFGWISGAEAVVKAGAIPVFVDIDEHFGLNPKQVQEQLNEKTKAIFCMHLFGGASDVKALKSLATYHNIPLIEDCAQSFGTKVHGQSTGTYGDFGAFSFYPTKNLGGFGEAGALTSQNASAVEKGKQLRNHGQKRRYFSEALGGNYRMDALQAMILSEKLPFLTNWIKQRQEIAKRYLAEIRHEAITLPTIKDGIAFTWHQFVIQVENPAHFRSYMMEKGIGTDQHYPFVIPELPMFRSQTEDKFPVAKRAAEHNVSLPIFPELKEEEQAYIIQVINAYSPQ